MAGVLVGVINGGVVNIRKVSHKMGGNCILVVYQELAVTATRIRPKLVLL
jgi:hypothetical protein